MSEQTEVKIRRRIYKDLKTIRLQIRQLEEFEHDAIGRLVSLKAKYKIGDRVTPKKSIDNNYGIQLKITSVFSLSGYSPIKVGYYADPLGKPGTKLFFHETHLKPYGK